MANSDMIFAVLNTAKVKRQNEADRHLPTWLANPVQFSGSNLSEHSRSIEEYSEYLDTDLIRYLKNVMNIEKLFPVQKCLIPSLAMQFKSRSYRRPNDICVSSPTGSGKTLAFAIPIVNYLKQSLTKSLRALIILPSRDLAQQVHKTFQQLCQCTQLRCALAAGESLDQQSNNVGNMNFRKFPRQDQYDGNKESRELSPTKHTCQSTDKVRNYSNNIAILISTPGTLVDLIYNSPGFTLEEIEILVIDEADRMMANHKHDWMTSIERSIFDKIDNCPCNSNILPQTLSCVSNRKRICFSSTSGCAIRNSKSSKPLHKLLFSATLSSDPQLLMQMNLFQPRLYLASKPSITGTKIRHSLGSNSSTPCGSPIPQSNNLSKVNIRSELLTSSTIPEQLEEKMFITEPKEKLFILWYLFHELNYKKVICFCNQLATSTKLCKFLNEIHSINAVEFSSKLKPETRQKYINEFRNNRIDVMVSTDLMARGMDVEDVEYVISYDLPLSEICYVHRVGRTARAGKKGTAITFVDTKQLVQFKKIVQLAHKQPHSMRLSDIVEEMKVPHTIKKNSEKYDLYTNTLENFEDKMNSNARKNSSYKKLKQY